MNIPLSTASTVANPVDTKRFFSELLTTMWLRPERALMESHMMSVLCNFIPPVSYKSLEWGCGDGSISFVTLGGEYNFDYDDYLEVEWINNARNSGSGTNLDFFDVIADISVDPVKKAANFTFSDGVSWKESHIAKAKRLGFHDRLIAQDFSTTLPYVSNYFDFILATNLFWIDKQNDLGEIMSDLSRVLERGGKLISIFPQTNNRDFIVADKLVGADQTWINMFDRGISNNLLYNARDLDHFERLAELSGLKITSAVEYCPSLISTIYQIGFRPMFPVFMNMYEKLKKVSPEKFLEIKRQWIDTVSDFMLPLCETEWINKENIPNTWYLLEFEKL